jgi:hypothetical protein
MEKVTSSNYGSRLKCKCGNKLFNIYVSKEGVLTTACHSCNRMAMENRPKAQPEKPVRVEQDLMLR